jgi:formylmethanofuran dehydrogenase subunit E
MKNFNEVVDFHGHTCPGLALGYRVSLFALKQFGQRSHDEEIVAIVENNSCAVDAVQVVTGCTFGKGNLIFRDYGKQVYSFVSRASGDGIRISVDWTPPDETQRVNTAWNKYMQGDRSKSVMKTVCDAKQKKIKRILDAADTRLFRVQKGIIALPEEARIYPSLRCADCHEKVMEPRARVKGGRIVCIPCVEKNTGD